MAQESVYGWPGQAPTQSLFITATEWDCSLHFENRRYRHRSSLAWEGLILKPETGLRGVKVMASFEIPMVFSDVESDDHDPPDARGTLYPVANRLVGLQLLVTRRGFAAALRLFASGFAAGPRGFVTAKVVVGSRGSADSTFWQRAWQTERLDVLRFSLHAGGHVKDRRTLLQRLGDLS